jgi:Ig-like domain-containing protein
MAMHKTRYLFWLATLVAVMACVPTVVAPPSMPTTDPNAINTYIVQTANVASSQTAAVLPTSTPTGTFTPTPRNTDTPEPTATATVLFLFYTSTPVVLPGTDVASSKSYACEVMSVTPADGTTFASRAAFDAAWKVKNIGKRDWDHNSVDYAYLSGDKFHKVATYDLDTTLAAGEIRTLVVAMQAPKNPGTYTTNWTLRISAVNFCTMSLTIVVK